MGIFYQLATDIHSGRRLGNEHTAIRAFYRPVPAVELKDVAARVSDARIPRIFLRKLGGYGRSRLVSQLGRVRNSDVRVPPYGVLFLRWS